LAPAQQFDPKLYRELRWRLIGPFRGGRSVAISGIPSQPNVFYMAANNGGVWKTTDYGRTWNPIFDDQPTGSIGALAIAPSNPDNPQIIYADMWASRRPPWTARNSYNGPGSGLYKSTDGGSTWRQLTKGLPTWNDHLGRIGFGIAFSDSNRIYALVDSLKLGGLYRSDDAGESWERINSDDRLWGRGDDFACVR